jgi:23S rRNA (cytosine1962-C5)-methyltransferase
MASVILGPGKERRLLAGHPWVYSGEIARVVGDPADGDVVDLCDHRKRFLGRGLLNRRSRIAVRRFTLRREPLDEAFFRRRIESALAHRRARLRVGALEGRPEAFRAVSSEADFVPGLVLDRYADHVVLQALTLGIDRRKSWIVEIVQDLFRPTAIVERSDVATRRLEGLVEAKGVLRGHTDGRVVVGLDLGPAVPRPFRLEVDVLEDQKTGLFLDQVHNYAEVARWAEGRRVLDGFSGSGGFALAAAVAGASAVEAVDSSEAALGRLRRSAELNGLADRVEVVCANAFDVLKRYDAGRRRFDLIVLDPPSFTRTRQHLEQALRGYKEINLRALKLLEPGGLLVTFSCSHHVHSDLFRAVVVEAAADARRGLRLIQALSQSLDHPILPAVPETEYLKGLLLEVV